MAPPTLSINAVNIDFSGRFAASTTVAASPSGATETTIGNITLPSGVTVVSGVLIVAFAAFTVGTNGVSGLLKIKRGSTVLGSSGAVTLTAANLAQLSVGALDTGGADGQAYTLTLTVASGSAASTVSGLTFAALIV